MTTTEFVDRIAGSLGYSMAKGNALSQGFATPVSYIAGRTIHGGLDIRGKLGTPIPAIRAGKVALSRLNGGWGENVIIQTEDGYFHWYCHLNIRSVLVGQTVTEGQQIGTLGTTGHSTGPHLHFECRDSAGQFYKLYDPFKLYPDTPPLPVPEDMPFIPTVEQQEAYDLMRNLAIYTDQTPRNAPVTTEALAIYLKRAADNGLLHLPA